MTRTWDETRNMLHEAGIPLDRLGVNPQSSTLRWSDLSWANLSAANLSAANLTAANLTAAGLSRADLTAANLSGVITHPANGEQND